MGADGDQREAGEITIQVLEKDKEAGGWGAHPCWEPSWVDHTVQSKIWDPPPQPPDQEGPKAAAHRLIQ